LAEVKRDTRFQTEQRIDEALGLIGYLFIGTGTVLIPSVMPSITSEFMATGLTLAAIGLIFPASAVGGILGNLLAGVATDLFGGRRLVWISALLLAASLLLSAASGQWLLFVIGYVVVSAMLGALSTGINALVADANRTTRAKSLNILHGVYGAGAAVSPLVIGYLIAQGLQWRWAFGATGLIWLVYALVAFWHQRAEPSARTGGKAQQLDLGMLRSGPFLALFLIGFAYNGIATSLLGWVAVIMQQSAGFSLFFSISTIAIFYVALTLGRFVCALFAERVGYATTLLVLGIGITVTYPLVVFGIHSWLLVVGVFLTGLSLSGLFPMTLAYGIRRYPAQSGTISGTLSVALTIGSMLPPLWTGVIASVWSFQWALGLNFLMAPPLILLALYLGRVETRQVEMQPVTD
jgi:FHS family glucose/mannose:H+ symporter-like MFS transporter